MLNTTFPFIEVPILLFPGTLANLPPPFFHTWLIRTLYYLIKGWSPHFCSPQFSVVCLSLLPPYFTAVPTLPFQPRWQKGILCHPIMNLCVVQKHRGARPSVYVNKNKYLNYICIFLFLTWDISESIPRCDKMFSTTLQQGLGEAFKSANLSIFSKRKSIPLFLSKKKVSTIMQVFGLYVNQFYKMLTLWRKDSTHSSLKV